MPQIIGLKELRENTEKYIAAVGAGKSFTVIRRAKPVFTITPVDEDNEKAWKTIVDFEKIKKGGVPADKVMRALEKNLTKQ